ncbi:MAG: hypothetical protein KAH84_06455, partial [Thiomargarita sp.]|nr:hypothetical protein [Thiomargarita sp.]
MAKLVEYTSTGNIPSTQTIVNSTIDTVDENSYSSEVIEQTKKAVQLIIDSALVEYIGKDVIPPKDVIAWVVDRDLFDPAIEALEVRILLNKKQLSSLVQVVGDIITAMKNAKVTERQFFETLQETSTQFIKDPSKIGKAKNLKESGLLPNFLESLPYRSEIGSLTDERFASWTTQKRTNFAQRLEAKLAQYITINESVDKWIVLDESDPNNKIYPLHIDLLP